MSGPNIFDLSGKVSLVTGAGMGLGRAFCEAMAESGSDVVCVDINKGLADKTAEITGATGVIGRGICKVLAKQGMQVAVADLSQDQCDRLVDGISASGGNALEIAIDVTPRDSTRRWKTDSSLPSARSMLLSTMRGSSW